MSWSLWSFISPAGSERRADAVTITIYKAVDNALRNPQYAVPNRSIGAITDRARTVRTIVSSNYWQVGLCHAIKEDRNRPPQEGDGAWPRENTLATDSGSSFRAMVRRSHSQALARLRKRHSDQLRPGSEASGVY